MPRLLTRALPVALALTLLGLGLTPGAQADPPRTPLPVTWSSVSALPDALSRTLIPGWHPAGSNDPTCRLTRSRPRPVVLVNFTTGAGWEWAAGSPYLRNKGFCVFSFNYGNITPLPNFPTQAVGDIRRSAAELSVFVGQVRAETGVAKVEQFVGIAPGNHGADGSGLFRMDGLGIVLRPLMLATLTAFGQQVGGTELAEEIYAQGDTRPGPHHTTIITRYDEIATPVSNQFLRGPNVTNIVLQRGCALDKSEHLSIGFSERTWRFVVNALAPKQATPVPCMRVDPYTGSAVGASQSR